MSEYSYDAAESAYYQKCEERIRKRSVSLSNEDAERKKKKTKSKKSKKDHTKDKNDNILIIDESATEQKPQEKESNKKTKNLLSQMFDYEKLLSSFTPELKIRLDQINTMDPDEFKRKKELDGEILLRAVSSRPPDVDGALLLLQDPKAILDLEQTDETGVSLLGLCCMRPCSPYHDNCTIIEQLIKRGANKNATNFKRQTLLMLATIKKSLCKVCRLLMLGVNVNMVDNLKETALTYAIRVKDERIAKRLLNAGANPAHRTQTGKDSWNIAHRDRTVKLSLLLSEHCIKLNMAVHSGLYEATNRNMPFTINDDPPLERLYVYRVNEQSEIKFSFLSPLNGKTIRDSGRVPILLFGLLQFGKKEGEEKILCHLNERCPVKRVVLNDAKVHLSSPGPGLSRWYTKLIPISTHSMNEVVIHLSQDSNSEDTLLVKPCFVNF